MTASIVVELVLSSHSVGAIDFANCTGHSLNVEVAVSYIEWDQLAPLASLLLFI